MMYCCQHLREGITKCNLFIQDSDIESSTVIFTSTEVVDHEIIRVFIGDCAVLSSSARALITEILDLDLTQSDSTTKGLWLRGGYGKTDIMLQVC